MKIETCSIEIGEFRFFKNNVTNSLKKDFIVTSYIESSIFNLI